MSHTAEYQRRFNETKMAAKRDEDARAATEAATADALQESVDTTATDGSDVHETALGNIKTYSSDYLDARCALCTPVR